MCLKGRREGPGHQVPDGLDLHPHGTENLPRDADNEGGGVPWARLSRLGDQQAGRPEGLHTVGA